MSNSGVLVSLVSQEKTPPVSEIHARRRFLPELGHRNPQPPLNCTAHATGARQDMGRHVVTNAALLHCHSLPSATFETGCGAIVAITRAATATKFAITTRRTLRFCSELVMAFAPSG
jgi:hypothetical protein